MRSQGQTIPYVIVDIGKVPAGAGLTAFNAYVVFTKIPSEDLEAEDRRLNALAEKTAEYMPRAVSIRTELSGL